MKKMTLALLETLVIDLDKEMEKTCYINGQTFKNRLETIIDYIETEPEIVVNKMDLNEFLQVIDMVGEEETTDWEEFMRRLNEEGEMN